MEKIWKNMKLILVTLWKNMEKIDLFNVVFARIRY